MDQQPTFRFNLTAWLLRLLLAALLAFSGEILLWTLPTDALDGLVIALGYLALGALVIDLAARYRIRDLFDVMALLGFYGLCAGLLLHPQYVLEDFPRTLISRVMGGFTALGTYVFGLWLALIGGGVVRYRRLLIGFAVWLGFYWGVWLRWTPILTGIFAPVEIGTALLIAGAAFGLVLGIYALVVLRIRRDPEVKTLRDLVLSPVEFGGVVIALLFVLIIQAVRGIDTTLLLPFAVLMTLCWAVLYMRHALRSYALLDAHLPPTPLPWPWIAGMIGAFVAASLVGWVLPYAAYFGYNQLSAMEFLFFAVGLAWLPVIAMVLAVRAFDRLVKTNKLW